MSGKGVTSTKLSSNAPTANFLGAMMGGAIQPANGAFAEKAGVNWILFDEQFEPVSSGGVL